MGVLPSLPEATLGPLSRGCRPVLALVRQRVVRPDPAKPGQFCEVETAAARLSFRYGKHVVRDAFEAERRGIQPDREAEHRARYQLERFGAVELECTECCLDYDGDADYLLDLDDDPHALCAFLERAVPALRAQGFEVETAPDFPCQVVSGARWHAEVDAGDDETGWFELRLGVDIDGEYVDMLPALLELVSGGMRLPRHRDKVALPVGGDRFLPVPQERLLSLLAVVKELYEIDGVVGSGLRVPALVPEYLDDVREALGTVVWGEGRRGAIELADEASEASEDKPEALEIPQLRATLRPYQRAGVRWLQGLAARNTGGILADDMGLGKTLQTIAYLVASRGDSMLKAPALVVAPTSLVGNWRRELHKFAPHLRVLTLHGAGRHRHFDDVPGVDVVITTYPLLVRDVAHHAARRFSVLVLDEAQTVKNSRSQAHTAVRALDAEQVVCLSGTPIENNLGELRALMELCVPGLLGDAHSFRARFSEPIERARNEDRLAALRRRVGPYILRRLKSEVATELPPKTEIVRAVEIGNAQRELYEGIRIAAHATVRGAIRKKGLGNSSIDILSALTKLRQACCDPRLVALDAARTVGESAKLEALLDMLEQLRAAGRRVLVFSQFTSMLALIAQALDQHGIAYLSLTGQTKARQDLVDRFERGEADVFLISLKAGGTGLNLVSADTVIHFDPWWNPAAQSQATDRAYRIGQTRPVHVYELIVAGSVEERMLGLQRRKRELAEGLLSNEGGAALTEADVEDLFAPLSE